MGRVGFDIFHRVLDGFLCVERGYWGVLDTMSEGGRKER